MVVATSTSASSRMNFNITLLELFFRPSGRGPRLRRAWGTSLAHHGSERINRFDAIVNEEDLAVASKFGFDGALHELFLKGGDDGLNGQTVARRRFR